MKISAQSRRFTFLLEFAREPSSLVSMNDWAKNTADRLRAHRQSQSIADEKFVQEQRIKESRGKPLWDEVKEAVRRKCEGLNLEMGETILSFRATSSFSIQVDVRDKVLQAEFVVDQNLAKWSIAPTGGHGEWELDVYGAKPVFMEKPLPHRMVDPEKMATTMLDALLR